MLLDLDFEHYIIANVIIYSNASFVLIEDQYI